jgi:hypothetical protein
MVVTLTVWYRDPLHAVSEPLLSDESPGQLLYCSYPAAFNRVPTEAPLHRNSGITCVAATEAPSQQLPRRTHPLLFSYFVNTY